MNTNLPSPTGTEAERTPLQQAFLAFREQCIWLQTCFDIYKHLYESGEDTSRLMSAAAPLFFHDLNHILIEYCLRQVSRLTDPPRSMGRDNLTVEHVNSLLSAEGKLTPAIAAASEDLANYRALIRDARNRIISHADRQTAFDNIPLGEHTQADVAKFFQSLYSYVDEVGRAIDVGPLDFRSTSGPGDVLDLLRYLKRGVSLTEEE